MNRITIIISLIVLQIIYYFAYVKFDGSGLDFKESFNNIDYIFVGIWLLILSANTYLLYNLFPMMKNYVKSKNILAEVLYFIACLLFGAFITNFPTENILIGLM